MGRGGHLSERPTRGSRGAGHTPATQGRLRPCLALLPAAVAWPHGLPRVPVGSYPTFSPLPAPEDGCHRLRAAGGLFLWPLRGVTPARVSPAPCPAEGGLSSPRPSPRSDHLTDPVGRF